ncbi:MAG TPA: sigma-70 family RNA polymerase sigma factor, partial [Xanthomonadales bacterium]|nr:sigma-70 family RNA polymerase sigma factor [Xanthomonadales bacterium]
DELRRRQWLELEDPIEAQALGPGTPGLAEHQAEAWQMLMRLPPRARAVLVLHAVEGYTHREMATLFGQSESFSKSILARALRRLQSATSTGGEDDDDERGGAQSHRL